MPRDSVARLETESAADSERQLFDALYADPISLIAGAVVTTAFELLCWRVSGSVAPLALALGGAFAAALRVGFASRQRGESVNWIDMGVSGSAIAYLFLIGVLTWWALLFSEGTFVITIAIFIYIINIVSIALRSFAVERVVKLHLLAIVSPAIVAFAMKGGYYYVAGGLQFMIVWFVEKSAARLRGIFLSEMAYRRRSESVAKKFRFAIDNMSHGMCLIEKDMRIGLCNGEFAECFGIPAARSLQGAKFRSLTRLAVRRGTLSRSAADRLLTAFDRAQTPDGVTHIEAPGLGDRVHELTLKRHVEGGWVLVVQDVTESRRAREALDVAAKFDAMTALPNRRSFEAQLNAALAAAGSEETCVEVLFLDLDGFKQINDTLGHKFGDRVLVESARRLRESAGCAYVSRWGGDEFVILRSGPDDLSTLRFAQGVIAELSRPMWLEGAEVAVGATVGAAVSLGHAVGADALLQQADMALYAAKREARGSCRLYETSMSEQAQQRRLLELDLQAALGARAFELNYQPIVDLETGELVSFEALARWRHPTRGNVSPDLFVRVLEDLNLMNAFGAWTLQKACEDAALWPLPVRIGVNVSTQQIETLVESVKRALSASGLKPERLELEITETAALASGDFVIKALETVRAMGVKIALDDFGTGYSSLSHLMRLPLDKVKIDKSFTQQLGKSRKADVLVANIARISSQLGMRVTFEGLETTEQLDRARALGVPAEGQGWLFGKPARADDLAPVFAAHADQAVA